VEDDLVAGREATIQGDGEDDAHRFAGEGNSEEAELLGVEDADGGAVFEW
jgi:hypothetical protein